MPGPRVAGLLAGLIFGLVFVWQGAGAAFLVLLFALVGWLLGLAVWIGSRIATGDLELDDLRNLIGIIFTSRT